MGRSEENLGNDVNVLKLNCGGSTITNYQKVLNCKFVRDESHGM